MHIPSGLGFATAIINGQLSTPIICWKGGGAGGD
ncbi:hypothetical protein A2U01_0096024, partial [Trifolium medium]|nr:hypothetical protein [Trifolium medium]